MHIITMPGRVLHTHTHIMAARGASLSVAAVVVVVVGVAVGGGVGCRLLIGGLAEYLFAHALHQPFFVLMHSSCFACR